MHSVNKSKANSRPEFFFSVLDPIFLIGSGLDNTFAYQIQDSSPSEPDLQMSNICS